MIQAIEALDIHLYAKLKRHEVEAYRKAVTDWEQKRYLEVM